MSAFFIQLTFRFVDGALGAAQETAMFTLTVEVNRNLNSPRFVNAIDGNTYTISEDIATHLSVISFAIADDDLRVCIFYTSFKST